MKAGLWPATVAPVGAATLLKELPLQITRLPVDDEFRGDVTAGESRTSTSVLADDDGVA